MDTGENRRGTGGSGGFAGARRVGGSAAALAGGGGGSAYDEFDGSTSGIYNNTVRLSGNQAKKLSGVKKNQVVRHSLFRKRYGK